MSGCRMTRSRSRATAGSAVPLSLEHLDLGDGGLDGGGAVAQGEPGGDSVLVAVAAVRGRAQFGQVAGLSLGEPALQILLAGRRAMMSRSALAPSGRSGGAAVLAADGLSLFLVSMNSHPCGSRKGQQRRSGRSSTPLGGWRVRVCAIR